MCICICLCFPHQSPPSSPHPPNAFKPPIIPTNQPTHQHPQTPTSNETDDAATAVYKLLYSYEGDLLLGVNKAFQDLFVPAKHLCE